MHPILFKIGPISIPSYGACFATGALLAIIMTLRFAKQEGLNKDKLSDLIFFTLLIALFGAKLFLFVTEFGYYMKHTDQIKYLLTSGGTFYGGLIFGILFGFWYVKKHKLNTKSIVDCIAPGLALAHSFGRLGCFLAGCCFGRAAHECSIAVTFPNTEHTVAPAGIPRFPTQLMESILNLLNFIILMFIYKKRRFKGQVFCFYLMNYSLIRFFVEFFRGDSDRGYIFGGVDHPFTSLSSPQLISIIGFSAGIFLYRHFKKSANKDNPKPA